jgi:hypothetical protein
MIEAGLSDGKASDDDGRALDRVPVFRGALLSIPGQLTALPCTLRDITTNGASIRLNGITLVPLEFEISFDGFRTFKTCQLIWRDGDFAGVAFLSPSICR